MPAIRAEEIARHYDVLESFYERIFGNLSIHYPLWLPGTNDVRDATMNSNRVLAEVCGLRPGMLVLDSGCGLGGSSFWLAEQFDVRVLGISLSESNIHRCQELAGEKRLTHLVEFATIDFMSKPFDDNSFDVVWNLESFNYACPKQGYIKNVYRILKPGGVWGCLDGFIDPNRCQNLQDRIHVWSVNRGFIHTWEHWEPVERLQKYMIDCGFEDVRWDDLTRHMLQAPRSRYFRSLCRGLIRLRELGGNPELYRVRFKSFLATHCTFRLMQRTAMMYGLLAGKKPLQVTS